jgi:hypothetical protein
MAISAIDNFLASVVENPSLGNNLRLSRYSPANGAHPRHPRRLIL